MASAGVPRDDRALEIPESRVGLLGVIWGLAWPVIVTFALESLVGLVDMVMVGRLGAAPVAGVGVGTQLFHAVSVVMFAVSTGTVAVVARHIGAGDRETAESALVQSVYSVFVGALALALPVLWAAEDLVALFGVEPAVLTEGTGYTRFMMAGMPMAAVFFVVSSGLRGAGDTRTPLLIGVISNVVNVTGNYALIFGHFGMPAMGVRGAALASALAFGLGAVLSLLSLRLPGAALRLRRRALPLNAEMMRRVMAVGWPTAAEQILIQTAFLLYVGIVAHYGTSEVAAYFIGVRILGVSFFPGFGFAAAASTLVGQSLGAGSPEDAERSGWETNRLGMTFMSAGGLLIYLAARPIARIFIDDPAVIDHTVTFITVLAICQPLMSADFTLGGALRGAGDTRFPLFSAIAGFYLARLGCAATAAFVLDLPVDWIWFALFGDYALRASLKFWRFHSGRWKTIRV